MYVNKRTLVSVVAEIPKRKCLTCETEFVPKKKNQVYCQRKCFKWVWNRTHKGPRKRDEEACPMYRCQGCGEMISLQFNPMTVDGYKKLREFTCEKCGTKRTECEI